MIIFKKIRWQNLLSTGNQFTEIYLNKSRSTLIVGENGAGKSTLIEAVVYVLYGKPFRNINKPQLINAITNKNMLVEIEFSIGRKNYLIRRGMKPNIFEIFIDNELINQNSDIREYQEMLEKSILKMSYKSFRQIVVLGSADYIPFMKLTPADRRQIIEDLLDIQIFSIMNTILKDKLVENKLSILDLDKQVSLVEQKIELTKKNINALKNNNLELIKSKEDLIVSLTEKINNTQNLIDSVNEQIKIKLNQVDNNQLLIDRKKKILNIENDLENKKRILHKEIKFFSDHDNCPTCKQSIDESFKTNTLLKRKIKQDEIVSALNDLESKLLSIDDQLEKIDKINQEINSLNKEISIHNSDIRSWNKNIDMLREDIKSISSNTTQINVSEAEIEELKKELNKNITTKKNLLDHKDILDISSSLLKDTGIKTRIIKQYIPVINKLVNRYLASLDFFVNFELDEKFTETIKSRFRDEFTYASFSEGEKFRIDISLMFTWRAIAKLRNSASTNLLIMDEVFDSSLDSTGIEEFFKILESLTGDTNTFIISHKGDSLYDKFHSVIKFEKHSNFSRIAI